MDTARCKLQIRQDEGESLVAYLDSRAILTIGVGHKVLPGDGYKLGATITQERCMEIFEADFVKHLNDVKKLFQNWEALPDLIQEVLVNMCFNLGLLRLSRFWHMIIAINHENWKAMKEEMIDSKWHKQVTGRAERLERMVQVVIDKQAVPGAMIA